MIFPDLLPLRRRAAAYLIAAPLAALAAPGLVPAPQRFAQEVATNFSAAHGLPAGGVQLLDLPPASPPLALAGGRWYALREARWTAEAALTAGPAECRIRSVSGQPVAVPVAAGELRQVLRVGDFVWAVGGSKAYQITTRGTEVLPSPEGAEIRQLAGETNGTLWAACDRGLFTRTAQAAVWQRVEVSDGAGRTWAARDVLGVTVDATGRVWLAQRAGVACRDAAGWRFFQGEDGLPGNEFTGLAAGPRGEVWFATSRGVIRWQDGAFHYRQGPRWLPADEVRNVVVDARGTAWCATAAGVGCLGWRDLTLAQKAEIFEGEITRHIARTPYGYVAESRLERAGDKSSAVPEDNDNDGLWTAMYGAGECFAYAATHDPAARQRAQRAFEALRFLQTVTQGGSNAPPRGFVARSIRPTDGPDPNLGQAESDRQLQQRDRHWKVITPRWPRSADGQWFWKCDTSSDELDGHFFFYPLYFDFCAETEVEKTRVREVVRELTDHLLDHGFALVDHDGRPTRWAVFGPQWLNHDPTWWPERGLNSLSLLSYLAVAAHITGDAKYTAAFRRLVAEHGYLQNAMEPKVQHGPGSGNQSDDEMAFMCFYTLLRYAPDAQVKAQIRLSLARYGANEAPEGNPFFNFVWAAHSLAATAPTPWGDVPVGPDAGWLDDALATLRGLPLDRLDWPSRNSHRLDLQLLSPQANFDAGGAAQRGRGGRRDGRVLPVENRHVAHWNTDPWRLDYGGQGAELAPGTAFLLPYYLGLYHGFIAPP